MSRAREIGQTVARVAALCVAGALFMCCFDGFHTHGGTTRYPEPWLFGMAWWVPFELGGVVGIGGFIYHHLFRWLGAKRPIRRWSSVLAGLVAFGAFYFASAFLALPNAGKLVFLALGFGIVWALLDGTWQGAVIAVGTAIAGTTVEVLLSHFGHFEHLQPDFAGVPMWLPALYLVATPVLGQLARRVFAPRRAAAAPP